MRNKSQKSVINVRHTVHMLVGDGSGKSEPSTGGGVAVSVGGVFLLTSNHGAFASLAHYCVLNLYFRLL